MKRDKPLVLILIFDFSHLLNIISYKPFEIKYLLQFGFIYGEYVWLGVGRFRSLQLWMFA